MGFQAVGNYLNSRATDPKITPITTMNSASMYQIHKVVSTGQVN